MPFSSSPLNAEGCNLCSHGADRKNLSHVLKKLLPPLELSRFLFS
jgi:hypothetical protein